MNLTYNNDVACAQFVGVIADTMNGKPSDAIANSAYLSFMIDGNTDISTKECVIIYSRILRKGRPVNLLIGHIEVQYAHAQAKFVCVPLHIKTYNLGYIG